MQLLRKKGEDAKADVHENYVLPVHQQKNKNKNKNKTIRNQNRLQGSLFHCYPILYMTKGNHRGEEHKRIQEKSLHIYVLCQREN